MSVVLVVGSSGSGKRTLIQGLVRLLEAHEEQQQQQQQQQLSSQGDGVAGVQDGSAAAVGAATRTSDRRVSIEQAEAEFDAYKAFVRTKYYKAEVTLWRQASALSILALRSVNLEGLEGIVVVFDLREDSSLEEGQQWGALVDRKEDDVAFRLCVGTKVDLLPENAGDDGSEGLQERRRRCLEWCLDHGFEYVEADCLHPEIGRDLREKEGVPRVAEAFQSNVWKEMEFQTDSRPSALATAARGRGILNDGGGGGGDGTWQGYDNIDVKSAFPGSYGGTEDGGREIVSEHLEGFVDPNRSGDFGDDDSVYGYGALGSEDGDDEQQHEQTDASVRAPSALQGDIDCTSPGGFGREGDGGEGEGKGAGEASDGGVERRRVLEELTGDGRRSQGPGIEPDHVELQAKWEVSEETSSTHKHAVHVGGKPSGNGNGSGSGSGDGKEASPDFGRDNQGEDYPLSRRDAAERGDGDGVSVRGGMSGGGEEKGGTGSDTEERSYLRRTAGYDSGDEMELLMGEVLKARELGGTVSDAERRARAANVAMRLAALLGEDGSSSDYDEEENNGD